MPQNIQIKKLISPLSPKFCENCGNKYGETDLNVINKGETGVIAHLKCAKCGNTYILNIINQPGGIMGASRVPFNTDLSFEEIELYVKDKKQISLDDILATYNYLQSSKLKKDIKELASSKNVKSVRGKKESTKSN